MVVAGLAGIGRGNLRCCGGGGVAPERGTALCFHDCLVVW